MSYYDDAAVQQMAMTQAKSAIPSLQVPSLRETLTNQLTRAQAEVSRLTEVISLLDSNQDTQRILELLGQGGGLNRY